MFGRFKSEGSKRNFEVFQLDVTGAFSVKEVKGLVDFRQLLGCQLLTELGAFLHVFLCLMVFITRKPVNLGLLHLVLVLLQKSQPF